MPDGLLIGPGASFHFAPGTVHRARGIEDSLVAEVSTPELDDVVRLEDYRRTIASDVLPDGRRLQAKVPQTITKW